MEQQRPGGHEGSGAEIPGAGHLRLLLIHALCLLLTAGCARDGSEQDPDAGHCCPACLCLPTPPPYHRQYVIGRIFSPTALSPFAADLDGDGLTDNRFAAIASLLESYGIDTQSLLDRAVERGELVPLLSIGSFDPNFLDDNRASLMLVFAKGGPQAADGGLPVFTIDPTSFPLGTGLMLAGGSGRTPSPTRTRNPPDGTLRVNRAFDPASTHHDVRMMGVDLTISLLPGRSFGEFHGSILEIDLLPQLLPAIANQINTRIAGDPGTDDSIRLLKDFDVGVQAGPCTAPSRQPVAADGRIDPCELANSPAAHHAFDPDVQLFGATGHYGPVPGGTQKDALSCGFGLWLTEARFDESE